MLRFHLEHLSSTRPLNILAEYDEPEKALEALPDLEYDLLFIDIQMPTLSGFGLLAALKAANATPPAVIFATAHDAFAIQAIRVAALDYLLKPVDEDELQQAVERAGAYLDAQATSKPEQRDHAQPGKAAHAANDPRIETLLQAWERQRRGVERWALPTFEGLQFVDPSMLSHAEADGNYTRMHPIEGPALLLSKPLKQLEDELEARGFFRIHHSHMVNLEQVDRYVRGDGGYVLLLNGTQLNVSRGRRNPFLERLGWGKGKE